MDAKPLFFQCPTCGSLLYFTLECEYLICSNCDTKLKCNIEVGELAYEEPKE